MEKEDEKNPTAVVDNAVKEIMDVAEKVKAENVVIYPYAHLSSSLGAPKIAKEILANMESALLSQNLPASRVPFGWYKAFEVSCKGHPLSELSRSISSEVPEDVKEESDEEESQFFILNEGELLDIEDYTYQSEDLKKLVDYELGRGESTGEEPPHVKLMREKNLADYEPSADVGHLRWYPKGRLIRDLLSDYVYTLVTDRGAMPVETPIMYDLADEAIRVHAEKFGERQYRMTSGKKDLMLRFAACFGAFRILADSFLTWKNLPVGIYELSTYSFRLEKKGEVVGLKRLRGFTMPDLHTVCSDVEQSLQEFDSQIEMCKGTGEALDVNYEVIFRATADFIEENREWINQAAARIGKPVLMEILPKRKHYWICKMDFAALDALGRPIENPTIQIDVESGKRFGITYIDSEEKEHHPYILHCSPTGSIERVICSLLEKSAMKMNDTVPMFPLWLSPTQVRVIPIAERHNEYAHKVAQEIKNARIRVDVDDRPETVGKKIRNAGKEWVPYVIVIGDREMESGSELTVNVRETGQKVSMGLQELIEVIQMETKGMPFRPLPLLMDLSRRVNF